MTNNLGTHVNDYVIGGSYDSWGDYFLEDLAILNKFAGATHTVADSSGTVTLTTTQCQNFSIRATGGTASQVDVRVPDAIGRFWYVRNDRASGAITVRCAAGGTSVTIAAGERRLVYSDGTDCVDLTLLTIAIASVSGLQAALDAKAPLASPTFTGTPTAPTATPGDNDTSIATTAFVKAAIDVVLGGVSSSFDTLAEIVAGMQPLDADLSAIAALTTTTFGRSLLTMADAAALLTALNISSGRTLIAFRPAQNEPPTSNYATFGTRNQHPYLAFDTATQEAAVFSGVLPRNYAGGGLTVSLYSALASATSGTLGWTVEIERIDATSLDIDADSFASAQTATAATVPGTSGQVMVHTVAFTSGAQMDSLAAGEAFRIRVKRDVSNDTATGDAQLLAVEIRET